MKRKLFFAGTLFLIASGINSCEALNDCKNCKQVTYVDGVYDHEGDTYQYCGLTLIEVENSDPLIIDNSRTVWECK